MFLCDKIQEFIERKTDKAFEILIINTPPQHGKSTTVTETLPSFYLARNPEKKGIIISYGDDLAERFGKRNLEKLQQFGSLFGIGLNKKKSTAREFELSNGKGRMISKGFGSGITGHTGDFILIDDPVKNSQEAESETYRNKIWDEFDYTVKSRTSAGAKIIVIMTRWHEDDLAGRILKEYHDRTTLINLPCEAEEGDPLGRKVGEALCPEIGKGNEWLKDFKSTYSSEEGVRAWNALYQGRPTAREGNILKRDWWQYYDSSDYENGHLSMDTVVMSVDAAFKDKDKNDYVSIGIWGKKRHRVYMIDCINEHLNFTATVRKIRVLKARYPEIRQIYIEDKANGTAIIEVLRNSIPGIIPVSPDASKEARVNAVSFLIEAGNVYLPRDKKIVWEFVEQCASFPNDKHDDMVDQMSQALHKLIFRRGAMEKIMRRMRGDKYFNIDDGKSPSSSIGKGDRINVI